MYQHLKNTLEQTSLVSSGLSFFASAKFKHQHLYPQSFNDSTRLTVQGVNSYSIAFLNL